MNNLRKALPLYLLVTISLLLAACARIPEAAFTVDVTTGVAPLTVKFTDQSRNKPVQWTWDFGDGTSSSEQNPSHTYNKAGIHNVKLTANNERGANISQQPSVITVSPGVLEKVTLDAEAATLTPEETRNFTAKAFDALGNEISGAQMSWKVSPGSGAINDKGAFTAGTKVGSFAEAVQAEVTKDGVTRAGKASITIIPGPLDRVSITPARSEVSIGGTQLYQAKGTDRFGNEIPNLAFRWTTGEGTVGNTGQFISGTKSGVFSDGVRVETSQGSIIKAGTAAVTIKPDPMSKMNLIPATVTLLPQSSQQFSLKAEDQYGNEISGLAATWQVASIAGTIDQNGLLAAGTRAGTYSNTVIARVTEGETSQQARAAIIINPESFDRVVLMPDPVDIGIGMQQRVKAQGVDRFGNKISDVTYTWKAGLGAGTIDQKGLFTAGSRAGSYANAIEVEARKGDVIKSARATVAVQPDRISFLSNRDGNWDMYIMDSDGSNLKRITSKANQMVALRPSPDGEKIAFQRLTVKDNKMTGASMHIMNADGSNIQSLSPSGSFDVAPDFSPDGSMIAFYSKIGESSEIFVMNADGSNRTRITRGNAFYMLPRWSPDGKKMLFVALIGEPDDPTAMEVLLMNSDGSGIVSLMKSDSLIDSLSWSPDGKKIAFYSNRDGNLEIYVMNANGSGLARLTNNSYVDGDPSWSPDGKKIAFSSNRDGQLEVYIMNPDGSEQVNLTKNDNHDAINFWLPRKRGVDPATLIPAFNARSVSFRFFEGPFERPTPSERVYGQRFAKSSSRYIWWQLDYQHAAPGIRTYYSFREVWYLNGGQWRERTVNTFIEGNWVNSFYTARSGGTGAPGNWQVGTYRVEIYIDGEKVASGQFEVY